MPSHSHKSIKVKSLCICLILSWLTSHFLVGEESLRLFPSPSQSLDDPSPVQWDTDILFSEPELYPVDESSGLAGEEGIFPIFFEGVPLSGKPTRVFAWIGIPKLKEGEKAPGIVLVHGGGGTAYKDWVKLWIDRGYAAIAMDTCGAMPTSANGMLLKTTRHSYSGAPFGGGGFSNSLSPLEDQWLYHAVAAVIRAHSLLREIPGVDREKIGITGVSWGGIITEIVTAVDHRFSFAAPVYGCGFLGENSFWLETDFQKLPQETVDRWIRLWDPSQYLHRASLPMLFCNGTNDKHFRPDSWQKTYRRVAGSKTLSMKVRMPHDHPPAGDPKEITVFADSILRDGVPLLAITDQGKDGNLAWVAWSASEPAVKAELVYTQDSGPWWHRKWETATAGISKGRAEVEIPENTTAFFFNLHDKRRCIVSSEHWDVSVPNLSDSP